MEVSGKVILVTGGAVRIGRAIACAAADEGMNVCLHYGNSHEEAEQTVQCLREVGVEATAISADLNNPVKSAKAIIDHACNELGSVDVLVNNASIFEARNSAETTEENWDSHLTINLKAPFFLCRAFAEQVGGREACQIINIADWRATRPGTDSIAYTISKAGLLTLTKSLAQEFAPQIRVNAICPGAILPPPGESAEYLERAARRNLFKQAGGTESIVHAVKYLLHGEFVTGEVMHVSGGEEL